MGTQNIGKPPATYRRWNGKQYLLDEQTYFGVTASVAIKYKKEWKIRGYSARAVKLQNGKYLIYRQYEP